MDDFDFAGQRAAPHEHPPTTYSLFLSLSLSLSLLRKRARKEEERARHNGRRVRYVLSSSSSSFFLRRAILSLFFLSIYLMLISVSFSLSLSTKTAFLNKKSWHTGGFAMIEEVWKRATSRTREEKTRGDEEGEFKREKVGRVATGRHRCGHSKKSERLDWM